jgi:outer membrane protein W
VESVRRGRVHRAAVRQRHQWQWQFIDRLALEVDATWADPDIESDAGTFGSVTIQPIAANLNFHFFPDKFVDIYVGGGFAYVNIDDIDVSGGGTVSVDSETAWDVQVGVDLNFGDHFTVVMGIRYYDLAIEGSGGEELAVDPLVSRIGAGWRW